MAHFPDGGQAISLGMFDGFWPPSEDSTGPTWTAVPTFWLAFLLSRPVLAIIARMANGQYCGIPEFEAVLEPLRERYGPRNVEHRLQDGEVVIQLTRPGDDLAWPHIFTWDQAKFLASNPLDPVEIIEGHFPQSWPR
jgi:hypothetical protein